MVALRAARNECRELKVHVHSVPHFAAFFFIPWPLQGLSAALAVGSLSQLFLCQFLDVVHHAVKVPLRVDLDSLARDGLRKGCRSLGGANFMGLKWL